MLNSQVRTRAKNGDRAGYIVSCFFLPLTIQFIPSKMMLRKFEVD